MSRQRAILVLGMHRSGTSTITRGLKCLGVELGDNLMRAAAGENDKGFWEDMYVFQLHQRLLAALGSSWDSVGLFDDAPWDSEKVDSLKLDAMDLVRSRFSRYPLWGFKDPRSVRLLPFWQDVLRRCGMDDSYVIVVRNPLSIVRSLLARNKMEPAKSYVLWLTHMLPAVTGTESKPRVVVDYDRVIADPKGQLERIARALDIVLDNSARSAVEEFAADFLASKLRHHQFGDEDLEVDRATTRLAQRAHAWLDRLAQDDIGFDDVAFRRDWRAIEHELRDMAPLLRYLDGREKDLGDALRLKDDLNRQLEQTREALADRELQLAARAAEFSRLGERLADAMQDIKQLNVERAELQTSLRDFFNSRSWRITAPLRATWRLLGAANRALKSGGLRPGAMQVAAPAATDARTILGLGDAVLERVEGVAVVDLGEIAPPATPEHQGQTAAPEPAIDTAVVLHLFYPELWAEIRSYLENLGEPFDLYVSIPQDEPVATENMIREAYPRAVIMRCENRGRDLGPFVAFLNDGAFDRYKYVCKIHSKKSLHIDYGSEWRRHLYEALLGSGDLIRRVKAVIEQDGTFGIVGPLDYLGGCTDHLGTNTHHLRNLLVRMGEGSADLAKLPFFAGSMFWFRPASLEPLRQLGLAWPDFETENGQIDGTLAHAVERALSAAVHRAGYGFVAFKPLAGPVSPVVNKRLKVIAFYLPQFHPIPENDGWWGKGFSEWTNVTRANPLFEGHRQPKLPTELGFYDLRLPESRAAQAALAREHGIHGFCYHYYWFNGKKLLDRPLREVLESGEPDFPFCVCWANENWTRRWDGLDNEILMRQNYGLESNRNFIRDVIPMMRDRRYIRYQGRPVLVIYRVKAIPGIKQTVTMWRDECRKAGIGEIHLCAVRFYDVSGFEEIASMGFDAMINFPPHGFSDCLENARKQVTGVVPEFSGLIYSYDSIVRCDLRRYQPGYGSARIHRGLMLGFDNTARSGPRAHIAHGATPGLFEDWLRGVAAQEAQFNPQPESLIFINAWNEWAEGTALEPDNHFGRGYLEVVKRVVEGATASDEPPIQAAAAADVAQVVAP